MQEIKSNEYAIAIAGKGEDGYIFTQNLNKDVACVIHMPYEDKIVLARQVTPLGFLKMFNELIAGIKITSDKKLIMSISFIGGEPNQGNSQDNDAKLYFDQIMSIMHLILGKDAELKEEKTAISRQGVVFVVGNNMAVEVRPLQLGSQPHPNSVIVKADNGSIESYDQWVYITCLGCSSTDEAKVKAVENRIIEERKSYSQGLIELEKMRQGLINQTAEDKDKKNEERPTSKVTKPQDVDLSIFFTKTPRVDEQPPRYPRSIYFKP